MGRHKKETPALTLPKNTKKMEPIRDAIRSITPQNEVRIIEVAKLISEGKTRSFCFDYIKEHFEVSSTKQASVYYQAALNWLIPDDLDKYKQGLIQANVERLEKIIQEGIDEKDDARRGADYLRTAKEAIAELNTMLGVGQNKVVVAENAEGDKAISIQFN